MSKIKKLVSAICENPIDVRYDDALKVANYIGFEKKGGSGSHTTYARAGEPVQLNFQEGKNGKAKPYQVKQLIQMIEKYSE